MAVSDPGENHRAYQAFANEDGRFTEVTDVAGVHVFSVVRDRGQ